MANAGELELINCENRYKKTRRVKNVSKAVSISSLAAGVCIAKSDTTIGLCLLGAAISYAIYSISGFFLQETKEEAEFVSRRDNLSNAERNKYRIFNMQNFT